MDVSVSRLACLVTALGLPLLLARSGRTDDAPASTTEPPAVEAVLPGGEAVAGRLVGMAGDEVRLLDAGGAAVTRRGDELVELRLKATPAPKPSGARLRATLVGGEVLVASSWGPKSDGLWLASDSFGRVELSFDVLRSLVPLPPTAGLCHDPAGTSRPAPGSDLALLVSGDEVPGTLLEARDDGLVLEASGGRRRVVTWADLGVLHLDNPCLAARTGTSLEVETRGGDVLLAGAPASTDDARTLSIALASDATQIARIPAAALQALRWRGGRIVDATSLPFTSEHTPAIPYPPGSTAEQHVANALGARVGRRPRGCPLRLDGRTYVHGVAVVPTSRIRLPLDAAYTKFQVLVGIDDEAKEAWHALPELEVPGDVEVRVLGDGKVLWEAKSVTGRETARRVGPLDVSGVRELVLEVLEGGHLNALDRVTWADPLLLR
jgi:hypothetical protein